jgi:uncharacterized lipoprotein YmbA
MRLILCLITLALLTACASPSPQTASYLLRADVAPTTGKQLADSSIALGSIRVASYIDQPGLVMAMGDGTIHAARYHQWAEPLPISLRRFMAAQISQASGQDISAGDLPGTKTRINLMIDQLHGDGKGGARLVAYWEVVSADSVLSYEFAEQQSLATAGYTALVQAEEALLKRLAAAMAASLESAGQDPAPTM